MAEGTIDRAAKWRSVYESQGFIGNAFTGIRFLGRTLLPDPYATRFRYRVELLQTALVPPWDSSLPMNYRLRLALVGYEERQYYPYGFDEGTDPEPYLSDLQRKCARAINDHPQLLENKIRFHEYMVDNGFGSYRPRRFGIIDGAAFRSSTGSSLTSLLEREKTVVIKEEIGGGGNRVYVCSHDDDGLRVNGELRDDEIESFADHCDRAIITEYCEQADYLDRLYPGSPNTLRIMTMRRDDGSVFNPAAVQRIGTEDTGALDNFSQGGISALIDLETGELSAGARLDDERRVEQLAAHPDTGVPIEGFCLPCWHRIREEVRTIAEKLPEVQYVGWDLLVTEPGKFVIVEGNHFPNPRMIQIHEPLLADRRVREFFDGTVVPT